MSLNTFTKFKIKDMELKNRLVMPPMCMYSAEEDGLVTDFHETHYISRAVGGTGLIILEATGVTPNGRISSNDLGIWSDDHIQGLKRIVDKSKAYRAKMAIQLAHAGRKCESNDEFIVGPSPIRFSEEYRIPRELTKEEISTIVDQFKDGARRSNEAGFDMIEIHGAHGYLIHEFLSPLSNKRSDEYGGSRENRTRFLKEILAAVKEVWPENKPIILRVSADDYTDGGIDKEEMSEIINLLKDDIDIVHVSSGGVVRARIQTFPGYQVSHAEYIREKCNIPVIAVGLIKDYDHVEEIVSNNRADLVAIGRGILRDPYFASNMAYANGIEGINAKQYDRGYFY